MISDYETLGFRWTQSTWIAMQDGTQVQVSPSTYLSSKEVNATTERQRKTLRLYRVTDAQGNDLGEKSELAIEKMMGEEA